MKGNGGMPELTVTPYGGPTCHLAIEEGVVKVVGMDTDAAIDPAMNGILISDPDGNKLMLGSPDCEFNIEGASKCIQTFSFRLPPPLIPRWLAWSVTAGAVCASALLLRPRSR